MRDVFCAMGPGVRGNVLDEQPPSGRLFFVID